MLRQEQRRIRRGTRLNRTPQRSGLSWTEVSKQAASTLLVNSTKACQIEHDDSECVLVLVQIAFKGEYRSGSQGNPDGDFILREVIQLLLLEPDAIIIDFQQVQYDWGNRLLNVEQLLADLGDSAPVGCVWLAGPQSERALKTLFSESLVCSSQRSAEAAAISSAIARLEVMDS